MCMYKIYCAKIASSSFVLQNCFRIKIIGTFRSQKALCNGRCRKSERRQGRRPSWPGTRKTSLPRQRPSGTPTKFGRVPGELRRRPEISEGVRNAGRTPQKLVPGKLRRRPQPPRGLGKLQNTPLNVSEGSEGSKRAAERFRGGSEVLRVRAFEVSGKLGRCP